MSAGPAGGADQYSQLEADISSSAGELQCFKLQPSSCASKLSPMPSSLQHALISSSTSSGAVTAEPWEMCLYSRAQRLGFWSRAWSKPPSECNHSQKLLILISATGDDC